MNAMMGRFYNFCNWVMLLAYVNFLWFIFTCLGLVVFGFMPATTAMFAVTRKWIGGNSDIPVFKTFWESYKSEFILSNKIGLFLLAIGYILYFYWKFFQGVNFILSLLFIGLFIYYFIMIIYIFPVIVHYKLKPLQYIKNALVISLTSPLPTLMIVLWAGTNYFIFTVFPGLIIGFGISITAFITMYFANRTFERLDNRYGNKA